MFNRLERESLQAMGLTVYQTAVTAHPAPSATPAAQVKPGFWQTRLGQNIRPYAEGIDTAALPDSVAGAEGKKSVWRMIRKMRNGR